MPRLAPVSSRARLLWLGWLYLVQGVPFGIQVGILPILMRARGASRTEIAIAGALGLPWLIKVLWAPVVDARYVASVGRRRSWILPLQAVAIVALLALAATMRSDSLVPVFVALGVLNLAMATMDVAVDGLAVQMLGDAELGPGNAAQVGGFKLGMLAASGLALQLLRVASWPVVFVAMAGIVSIAFVLTLLMIEPPSTAAASSERTSFADVIELTRRLIRDPASRTLALVVLLYKAGESMADSQWKPFLVDSGFRAEEIGLSISLFGGVASTLGSFVGGAIGARSRSLVNALFAVAVIRIVPLVAQALVVSAHPSHATIVAVSLAENFGGGMLTTLVYALMMSSADPTRAGTSFTVLATVDALGRGLTSFFAGVVADREGDLVVFGAAALLSTLFLGLYPATRAHEARGGYERSGLVSGGGAPGVST